MARAVTFVPLLGVRARCGALPARAADTVNAYSIWPENWARPMFEEFEKATGIKVNFVRFSSGEALARVIAEKGNPRVDVLFGGPVETFAAGIGEGVFESYKPPAYAVAAAALQARRRAVDRHRRRSARVHDQRQVPEGAQPQGAGVVERPPQPGVQEHAADGRRADLGHRRHAHLLDPRSQRPRRDQGVRLHEEAAAQRPALHQERRRRHAARGPRPGRRRHLLHRRRARHQGQGLRRDDQLSEGRHRHRRRGHRAHQGRQESGARQEAHRLGDLARDAGTVREVQDQLRSRESGGRRSSRASPRC